MGPARFYRMIESGGVGVPAAEVQSVTSDLYDQIQQQQTIDPAEVALFQQNLDR
jgi:hypothetical protein